ncbi:MAG: heavy metal translocating P-type ATPase [Acidimicrobiaceae bacterium]|nr:heavy metal translocating P-type ATPase [Acidimicrobiaceae bacterium]MCS5673907.1 cation-translocating P-type ATPase [Acidimicrobiales bacterium]|tara:strand:- start:6596 stop:8731 length:2136 start_codon:yes stop_codon:yes gene_type:complete
MAVANSAVNQTSAKERTQFIIEGMTCTACAARIETALSDVEGVLDARVNFATATSLIWHNETVDRAAMRELVASLGFRAVENGNRAEIQAMTEATLARRTVPALAIAFVAMATMFFGFPGSDWAIAALSTVSVWWAGWTFHHSARLQILQRSLAMDTLVSLGTLAAWSWSVVVLVSGADRTLHFEGAAAIVAFVLLGKWWEARAMRTSGDSLRALADIAPSKVHLGDGSEIPVEDLEVGMKFIVAPGERVATDGRVVEGISEVDASQTSGESSPVEVAPGAIIAGGVLNGAGALVVEATAVGEDTEIARVARLVEDAQAGQAPIQRLADRLASIFVPIVVLLAVGTLVVRLILGHDLSDALTAAIAVLIVSCPCSLGLATPLAVLVGTGRAAQLGVIVAGAHVLDSTRSVDTVVFDKTGTLTRGKPTVVKVTALNNNSEFLLSLAGSLESRSEHPIARAFSQFSDETASVSDFLNHPGQGITGTVNGVEMRVGKRSLFEEVPASLKEPDVSGTRIFLGRGPVAEAAVSVTDEIRPTSAAAISSLRDLELEVVLLSGDSCEVAEEVARAIRIDNVIAEVLPEEKRDHIAAMQANGQCVAMVGDGINDTPALAVADLGIAMQSGTDAARNTADLTIMSNDPRAVADGIALSRKTLRVIKVNLMWAFSYNAVALPLAIIGSLAPTQAAIAMALSSFLVVTNSLRLRRFRSLSTN